MFSLRLVKLTRYFSPDQTADIVDMKQGKVSQRDNCSYIVNLDTAITNPIYISSL